MEKNVSQKVYSIIAGAILASYFLFRVGETLINHYSFTALTALELTALLALAVIMFIKNNSIVSSIAIGVNVLINFYWFVDEIIQIVETIIDGGSLEIYGILLFFGSLFYFVAPMALLLFSIFAYMKKTGFIRKIWFVPLICEVMAVSFYMVFYISLEIPFGSYVGYVIREFILCAGFAFVALSFSKVKSVAEQQKPVLSDIPVNTEPAETFVAPMPVQQPAETIENMVADQQSDMPVQGDADKTEEIRNYKKLLEEGIITEEEFAAKKKQLMGL